MAQRIVDLLEAIKIECQQGEAWLASRQVPHSRIEPVAEQGTVAQARQRIMQGAMLGLGPLRLQLGRSALQVAHQNENDGAGDDEGAQQSRKGVTENSGTGAVGLPFEPCDR